MSDHAESSLLVAPATIGNPSELDLEAGPGDQIQCRICLETDGNFASALFVDSEFPYILIIFLGFVRCF